MVPLRLRPHRQRRRARAEAVLELPRLPKGQGPEADRLPADAAQRAAENLSQDDKDRQQDIVDGYNAMLDKPFMPHAIARTRHRAYQYCAVMKYLDNLIAWGDDLFQQDTIETINEATLLYVLAANILGPRPERIPPIGSVQAKTFADLKAIGLDKMGDALVELEAAFPFNLTSTGSGSGGDTSGSGPLFGIGRTLYFCVPRNDKLLGYWDTVADRLFKIRHCMNIEGVVRQLALFDPPIDPGMLIAAAAAGIDVGSIVSGLNAPVGPLRSLPLIQKAVELSVEVRSLGGALLSALEKADAEHLALIRQRHEIQIQQLTQDVPPARSPARSSAPLRERRVAQRPDEGCEGGLAAHRHGRDRAVRPAHLTVHPDMSGQRRSKSRPRSPLSSRCR